MSKQNYRYLSEECVCDRHRRCAAYVRAKSGLITRCGCDCHAAGRVSRAQRRLSASAASSSSPAVPSATSPAATDTAAASR